MTWLGQGWPRWRVDTAGRIEQLDDDAAAPRTAQLGAARAAGLAAMRAQWGKLIAEAAAEHIVPESWIGAVMFVESAGNRTAVSPAGAVGLMQLMPQYYGGNTGGRLFDARLNVSLGAKTLRRSLTLGLTLPEAYSCYNAGPGKGGRPKPSAKPFGLAHDPPAIQRVIEANNTWLAKRPAAPPAPPRPPAASDAWRPLIVAAARQHVAARTPYQWGGGHHGQSWGLDCSGLILDCARKAGIEPGPWDTRRMRAELPRVAHPKPGDVALYSPRHVVLVESYDPRTQTARIIGANGGDSSSTSPERAAEQDARVKRETSHLYRGGFQSFHTLAPWFEGWTPPPTVPDLETDPGGGGLGMLALLAIGAKLGGVW